MAEHTPEHWALVSKIYREAMAAGESPRMAIVEHFGVSPKTATAWGTTARKKGLLTVICPPGGPQPKRKAPPKAVVWCGECGDRPVAWAGKCKRCYHRNWSRQWREKTPVAECAACGLDRRIASKSRGWCEYCLKRWNWAGRPDSGPPPMETAEARRARLSYAGQMSRLSRRLSRELDEAIRAGGWTIPGGSSPRGPAGRGGRLKSAQGAGSTPAEGTAP